MKRILILAASVMLLAAGCNQAVHSNSQGSQNGEQNQNQQSQATSSPVNLPQGEKNGWDTYTSPAKYGFSIKYPKDFGFNTNYTQIRSIGYIPVCDEATVGCAYYTGDKYKGTNLDGAGVSVNILKNYTTEAQCYNFKVSANEAQNVVGTYDINGVDFKSATGGGGAAGHATKVQVYRNFRNGACYEIAQRISWSNIGNYEPGTVKQFNENEIWSSVKLVAGTFEFTGSSAVPSTGTPGRLEFSLGEKVTLKKNQTAYMKGASNVALKLIELVYSPCPEGAQCFWSGLDVRYEMTVGSKTYDKAALNNPQSGAPYQVSVADTDYKTYATFVVVKTPAVSQSVVTGITVCLPHKNAQPGQPQTLECALGLKEDGTGKYYGLKNSPEPMYDVNRHVQVTGTFVSNPSSIYDVVGDIEVKEIKQLK